MSRKNRRKRKQRRRKSKRPMVGSRFVPKPKNVLGISSGLACPDGHEIKVVFGSDKDNKPTMSISGDGAKADCKSCWDIVNDIVKMAKEEFGNFTSLLDKS